MISFLLICILCAIFAVKSIVLSFLSKNNLNTTTDGILINGLIFLFAFIFFSPHILGASLPTIIYGMILGTLSVLYQLAYLTALSAGPLSLTGLVNNLAMVVPIAVSAIFYKEPLSALRIAGIILTIVALFINTKVDADSHISKKWCIIIALSFIANGLVASTTKIYSYNVGGNESFSFVACSYLTAAVLSAIVYLVFKLNNKPKTFKYRPTVFALTAIVGILLGSFQSLYTYASSIIDGTLLFPAYNGGATLLVTLSGVILFREKLSKRQLLGVLTGAAAIILMCF